MIYRNTLAIALVITIILTNIQVIAVPTISHPNMVANQSTRINSMMSFLRHHKFKTATATIVAAFAIALVASPTLRTSTSSFIKSAFLFAKHTIKNFFGWFTSSKPSPQPNSNLQPNPNPQPNPGSFQLPQPFPASFLDAVKAGNLDYVKIYLKEGAQVNEQDENGYTSLHHAALCNRPEIAAELIKEGANINAKNKEQKTPLHLAVKYSPKTVDILVDQLTINIDPQDNNGDTPLHTTFYIDLLSEAKLNIVKKLLSKNANVCAKNNQGYTPLHIYLSQLSSKGHTHTTEIFAELLKANANLQVKDSNGDLAIHYAARGHYPKILQRILEVGGNANARDSFGGRTPLTIAIESLDDASKHIKILVQHGANVDERTFTNVWLTPLMLAALKKKISDAKALIACKANINAMNLDETALHYAIRNWNTEMVSLLLASGADYNIKATNGYPFPAESPLELAERSTDGQAKASFIRNFKLMQKISFLCAFHSRTGQQSCVHKLEVPLDVAKVILQYDFENDKTEKLN